ncbi:fungal-specific transcription factor domain-containing protein, partial [Peziza echinospora]
RNPACDSCRDKKVRCGREKPICHNCKTWKVRCTYSDRVKRDSEASRTIQRFEEVFERLDTIEATMLTLVSAVERVAGLIGQVTQRSPSIPRSTAASIASGSLAHHVSPPRSRRNTSASISSPQNSLVVGNSGSVHYLGSSSLLSITQEAESLIADGNQQTAPGDDGQPNSTSSTHAAAPPHRFSIKSIITAAVSDNRYSSGRLGSVNLKDYKTPQWENGLTVDLDIPPPEDPLTSALELTKLSMPDESTANALVDEYFKKINIWLPLFDEGRFRARLAQTYANGIKDSSTERGWLVCVNNVFLFGIYGRSNYQRTEMESGIAAGFFFNAWAAMDDISVLLGESLENVQALCTGAVVAIEISKPGLCWSLLSQACRLAMTIGLHRNVNIWTSSNHHGTAQEKYAISQERKSVFWNLYILDKALSLTFGRPTCLPDFDCDVELPVDDGTNPAYKYFNALVGLSRIRSGIYMRLYSATAGKMSVEERQMAVDELDEELNIWWKESGEAVLAPQQTQGNARDIPTATLEHAFSELELRFNYYNSLVMVHRMAPPHPNPEGLVPAPQTKNSLLCLTAARTSIEIIEHAIKQNPALAKSGMLLWLFQYYPFTAFFTLFAEIVRNPRGESARSDWALMRVLGRYLDIMRVGSEGARNLAGVARAFIAIALDFLKQGRNGGGGEERSVESGKKRRNNDTAEDAGVEKP